MVRVVGIPYLFWICLLVVVSVMRNSNCFRMAFFRYADRDPPDLYLTESEIFNASKTDKRWKEEAEKMELLHVWTENAVEIQGTKAVLGLEMEVINMMFRRYNCE